MRPDRTFSGNGKDTLRWGIVIAAVGLALCVGLYPIGLLPGNTFPLGHPSMLSRPGQKLCCEETTRRELMSKVA